MQDLLEGYRATRRALVQARNRTKRKEDRELLGGMISDCRFVVEWLETGRQPSARRGIERWAAYDREIPTDPALLSRCASPTPPRRMEINDYNRLLQVMAILSHRERQCFEMHHVGLWSEYEIADHLGLSRDSVHEYLDRAQRKIQNFISKPVQMELFPMAE